MVWEVEEIGSGYKRKYKQIEEEDQLWIERPSGNEDEEQHNQSMLRRSSRVSYPVQRFTYDSFIINHYAYISQVIKL